MRAGSAGWQIRWKPIDAFRPSVPSKPTLALKNVTVARAVAEVRKNFRGTAELDTFKSAFFEHLDRPDIFSVAIVPRQHQWPRFEVVI